MICPTCNLHYPDHLNFCRRCGNTLAETMDEPTIEAPCCTRCGARFLAGENFCQQCGYKLSQRSQETVVGGCYGCGTAWRSGWLYCRKCGLDRDQALIGPVSASGKGVAEVIIAQPETLDDPGRIPCPACATPIRPYSRYCETCGGSVSPYSRPIVEAAELAPAPAAEIDGPVLSLDQEETDRPEDRGREPVAGETAEERNQVGVMMSPQPLRVVPVGVAVPPVARGETVISPETSPPRAAVARRGDQGRVEPKARPRKRILVDDSSAHVPGRTVQGGGVGWRTFGWISVVIIILGVVVSWWFLRNGVASLPADQGPAGGLPKTEAVVTQATSKPTGDRSPNAPEGMVLVAGGTLRMGRDNGDKYEKPVHEIKVAPFFLDLTEVTNEMYLRFVRASGAKVPAHWVDGIYRDGEALHPVVNVSWDEAKACAEWMGKRLPSEAEWEFAARGTDGRLFPWGNDWRPGCANAADGSTGRLLRVGSYPNCASPFGVLDLSGNAWEWTADRMVKYDNPVVILAEGRVIRGGAYDVGAEQATATYRGVVPDNRGYDKTGFRCAMDVK